MMDAVLGLRSLGQGQAQAAVTAQLKSWCELTVGETPALEDKTAVAMVDHRSTTRMN